MKNTIAEASKEYLAILAYVEAQPERSLIEYEQVEDATGVEMDASGKAKLARAIIKIGDFCSPISNVGYQLGTPQLIGPKLRERGEKIKRQAAKAKRELKSAERRNFLEELPPEEKKRVLEQSALLNGVAHVVREGRKIYTQATSNVPNTPPPVFLPPS